MPALPVKESLNCGGETSFAAPALAPAAPRSLFPSDSKLSPKSPSSFVPQYSSYPVTGPQEILILSPVKVISVTPTLNKGHCSLRSLHLDDLGKWNDLTMHKRKLGLEPDRRTKRARLDPKGVEISQASDVNRLLEVDRPMRNGGVSVSNGRTLNEDASSSGVLVGPKLNPAAPEERESSSESNISLILSRHPEVFSQEDEDDDSLNDEPPDSTSGTESETSSSSTDIDREGIGSESESDDESQAGSTQGFDESRTSGSLPTLSHPASDAPTLQARLASFLPRLRKANDNLLDSADILQRRVDEVGEDESEYIEMNLGLGVLKEKARTGDGQIILHDSASSSDDSSAEDCGSRGEGGGRKDVMNELMGRKVTKSSQPTVQELG